MNLTAINKEAELVIPMISNWELVAAGTAAVVAELMGFSQEQIDEIRLAVVEACINAFEHGASEDNKVYIKYIVDDEGGELAILIMDHGKGFRPGSLRPPPGIEDSMRGGRRRGWGLELIRNFMDLVDIDSGSQGTTITMRKRRRKLKETDS